MLNKRELYAILYNSGVSFGSERNLLTHTREYSQGKAAIRKEERDSGCFANYDRYLEWLQHFLAGIGADLSEEHAKIEYQMVLKNAQKIADMEDKCYNCDGCDEPIEERNYMNCYQTKD